MTPELDVYKFYEEVKRELCELENMTPEEYEKAIKDLAETLGI